MRTGMLVVALLLQATIVAADPLTLTIPSVKPPTPSAAFHMGRSSSPNGPEWTVDGASLLFGGRRVVPVMGEFHFSRYAPAEWREELLKMKAGGVTIVSTYVFWIHHEETEGTWDWSGARDLRKFAQLCQEVGLPLIVRIGPWDHGEVRNGGFPEWLLDKHLKLRSESPEFLKEVHELYAQVGEQLRGLLYKDGGAVIGVQVDNEFRGPASYLLTLKKMAQEAGLDVPYYTRTGWPNLTSPMPFGEILPLYGAYAEGFWDRSLEPMPGTYWQAFMFAPERTDTAVGTDVLGTRQRVDEANVQQYPYLTCELGGGMMTSYHRRIHIDPRDALAVELAKVGSGSNLPGFYMYHGGTNPDAHDPTLTLQEIQSSRATNSNDMPVKTYDFQAPLGEFGQVRESYHLLRRTHLFLKDFAEALAPMPALFPSEPAVKKGDATTLRWAVRSDGRAGFVFVNNYERGREMPAKPGVQWSFTLPESTVTLPTSPIIVPANIAFYLPFNMDLGGVTLLSASAQPVCRVVDGNHATVVFAEIPSVPAEFVFPADVMVGDVPKNATVDAGTTILKNVSTGPQSFIQLHNGASTIDLILLDNAASLHVWRGMVAGKERLFFTDANLTLDGDNLTLQSTDPASLHVSAIPPMQFDSPLIPVAEKLSVTFEQTQEAGTLRTIPVKPKGNAMEPTDAEFDAAAAYRIHLPANSDVDRTLLLRLNYVGDVARLYLDGKLIADNFYNGTSFDLGLARFAPDIYTKPLVLKILPLRKDAPIYIQKEDRPDFGGKGSVQRLDNAVLLETYRLTYHVK